MLLPEPELTEPAPDAAEPTVSLRRRIPAVAAAEPRGAMTPGLEVDEEEAWDCEEPLAIVSCKTENSEKERKTKEQRADRLREKEGKTANVEGKSAISVMIRDVYIGVQIEGWIRSRRFGAFGPLRFFSGPHIGVDIKGLMNP
ncbi:hypothetical protein SLE2022_002670 [Rubroshorea leprosula]